MWALIQPINVLWSNIKCNKKQQIQKEIRVRSTILTRQEPIFCSLIAQIQIKLLICITQRHCEERCKFILGFISKFARRLVSLNRWLPLLCPQTMFTISMCQIQSWKPMAQKKVSHLLYAKFQLYHIPFKKGYKFQVNKSHPGNHKVTALKKGQRPPAY